MTKEKTLFRNNQIYKWHTSDTLFKLSLGWSLGFNIKTVILKNLKTGAEKEYQVEEFELLVKEKKFNLKK